MEKIIALSNYEINPMFTDRERAALSYAEAMTYNNKGVDEDLFQRLKKHFNDDEIIELTGLIGYQNLSSKFNAALDVPTQGFCLPQPPSKL